MPGREQAHEVRRHEEGQGRSAPEPTGSARRGALPEYLPLALILLATALVYLPSLDGPLLGYDDDWLIRRNTILQDSSWRALGRIWFDWSFSARVVLGAEYLPVRDTNLWLEARLWGLEAFPLRLSQLALYLAAVVVFRAALRRAWPDRLAVEVATAAFALHPVHVESAAWLASRKDVLALLFIGLALHCYGSEQLRRRWLAPLAIVAACLSKSMSVAAPLLLPTVDLLRRRRPDPGVLAASAFAAALTLIPHLNVGQTMHMVSSPLGGSRVAAAWSMGPVWLRYLGLLVWPPSLSIVHEVPILNGPTPASLLGYGLLLAWSAAGTWAWWRRGRPVTLAAFIWFLAPLLPVSQVAFPLQNAFADRYAFLSVLAFGLALGTLVSTAMRALPPLAGRFALLASIVLVGVGALFSARRAELFSDESALFLDAMPKAPGSPIPHYQYGMVQFARGHLELATPALEIAVSRLDPPSQNARRATLNLSRAYAAEGRLAEAEQLLRRGREQWPHDPKQLANLARVLARQGKQKEAAARFAELRRRFPTYLEDREKPLVGP